MSESTITAWLQLMLEEIELKREAAARDAAEQALRAPPTDDAPEGPR